MPSPDLALDGRYGRNTLDRAPGGAWMQPFGDRASLGSRRDRALA
jgi:hypothetical protein